MKRRKQIGKLIYTPRWEQGDVELGEDYERLSREEKLEVLAHWITELLSIRNEMIPNIKSWHHFMGEKNPWQGLTGEDLEFWAGELGQGELGKGVLRAVADHLKEKNS